ncbi:MAG: response regulator [Bacteroidales bacterium]|nr:response regulator [Bacteroidales bacterium]
MGLFTCELLRDASGNPYRIAGSHTDITHRKNQEAAIILKQQLMSAIVDSTDELLRNANYVDALEKVMRILGQTTKTDRVYLFQLKNNQYFKIVDWFSPNYKIDNYFDFSDLSFNETEIFINQIIENKSFFASNLLELSESPVKKTLESQNVLSILIFPLFVEEKFWGFVGFNDATIHHPWTDDEFSILNSFSGTLSKSIERTLLQERLNISLEKAKEASKAKSDFLSTMSHEIRTPLNGVIGFVDLMKRTELNSSQQQYMESVSLSANTLLDLINDVLDYSKIEAGKLILNPVETPLIELMEQIVEMIQFSAHQKNLEIILKIPAVYPEFVWIDSLRIRQVLINLLSNAIKFTDTGEVELGMDTISQTDAFASLKFWVKDTGIGIHQEKTSSILESFTQGDASVTRKYGGSGLGLAIATKILNIMNSKLEVKSTPGKGSIFAFTIDLPIRKQKMTKESSPHLVKNALIVDDNKQNRMVLQEMLKSNNIFSQACSSGAETLKELEKNSNFDVLIIDYHMPEMDGLSLIENIRNNHHEFGTKVPIMLLHSSYDDKFISDKSKELKINAHYVKPMKLSQLNYFIRNIQSGFEPEIKKPLKLDNEFEQVLKKPFKILIAEDNPTNMLLVKKMLSLIAPNSTFIEAKDGQATIDILSKADVDIVFMDIHMPEMSGTDATKYIRSKLKNKKLPIIALTADTSKDEKEKCFAVGMDDYLSKPVIINDIKDILIKHLA